MYEKDLKAKFIKNICEFTKIDQDKLEKALKGKPVLTVFEYPAVFNLSKTETARLEELRETLDIYNAIVKPERKINVKSPDEVASLFMEQYRYEKKEHFIVLLLNTKNEVISKEVISVGSLNSSIVHPREVFNKAVQYNACSLICLHNHPSGNPMPSQTDIDVTRRLVEAGELMGIKVLDHLILGDGDYVSLKEKMLLEEPAPYVIREVKEVPPMSQEAILQGHNSFTILEPGELAGNDRKSLSDHLKDVAEMKNGMADAEKAAVEIKDPIKAGEEFIERNSR